MIIKVKKGNVMRATYAGLIGWDADNITDIETHTWGISYHLRETGMLRMLTWSSIISVNIAEVDSGS